MGYSTERWRSYVASQTGQAKLRQAEQSRLANERVLRQQEMQLGTEEQLSGELPGAVDDALIPFLGSYSTDEGVISTLESHEKSIGIGWRLRKNVQDANRLLEQAREAAAAGDIDTASDLRARAEGIVTNPGGREGGWYPVLGAEDVRSAIVFNPQPEVEGASRLGSPMAQTVGTMVKEGREILDRGSETSKNFRRSLTQNAERAITAEMRGASRQARQLGMGAGAATNPYQARAVESAIGREAAQQRARLHTEAQQAYEQYRVNYAKDSVKFAQAYLQGQSFIREPFQAAKDNLSQAAATLANFTAQRSMQFSAQSAERAAASKARTGQILGASVGALAGLVTGGLGLAGTLGAFGAAAPTIAGGFGSLNIGAGPGGQTLAVVPGSDSSQY